MSKRHGIGKSYSKKLFRKTAGNGRVHPKNGLSNNTFVMRGGIRL